MTHPRARTAQRWGNSLNGLGVTLYKVAMNTSLAVVTAAGGVGLVGAATWAISQVILLWASSTSSEPAFTKETIRRDRRQRGFDSRERYVAVCGPSGSGKSSIVNSLRGLRNSSPDAARAGTTETTLERRECIAAPCFRSLCLVDFPGAGTRRVSSQGYYRANKLYCYDYVLTVCGERFGEIEIALVKACVVQGQMFAIIRSRSDEAIRRVSDDKNISFDEAKARYVDKEMSAIAAELVRSCLPRDNVMEFFGFFALVNKNTLRRLTVIPTLDWPEVASKDEIHERILLQFLGKAGVTNEHVNLRKQPVRADEP